MPIALSEEHVAQRLSVRRWLDAHCPPEVPRSLLDAEVETLVPVWKGMAGQGWLGIHLPEDLGGQGFGLFELAVVLEETGWSAVPGPLVPTTAAAALLVDGLEPAAAAGIVPGLADGTSVGAVAFDAGGLEAATRPTVGSRCREPSARCWGDRRPRWWWRRTGRRTARRAGACSRSTGPGSGSTPWPAWIPRVGWPRSRSTAPSFPPPTGWWGWTTVGSGAW